MFNGLLRVIIPLSAVVALSTSAEAPPLAKLISPNNLGQNWSQIERPMISSTKDIAPSPCNVVTALWGKKIATTVVFYSLPKEAEHFSLSEVVGTIANRAALIKQIRSSFAACSRTGKLLSGPRISGESYQIDYEFVSTLRGVRFITFDYVLIGPKFVSYLRSVGKSEIVLPAFAIAERKLG